MPDSEARIQYSCLWRKQKKDFIRFDKGVSMCALLGGEPVTVKDVSVWGKVCFGKTHATFASL